MSEQPTSEIFEDWEPPQLSEEASSWLLSQLSPQVFLRFVQAIQQKPEGQTALSGFRISHNSIKKSGVKQAIAARLVSLLVSSRWVRSAFFILSFPQGRWFRWAEVIDAHDKIWLKINWRELIRGTGDPALAVAFAMDDRLSLSRRGERALKTRSIWKEELTGSKELLPEPWAEFSGLLGSQEFRDPSKTEALENLQIGLEEISAKLQRTEQDEVKQKKARKKLEAGIGELEAKCLEQESSIRKLKEKVKEQSRHIKVYKTEMESEVRARVADFYREFCNCDLYEEELWNDSMKEGGSKDLLKRAGRALTAQSHLDARYGNRSKVIARLKKLESKYEEVEKALGDVLVPAPSLLKARKDLQLEIAHWRQMLPGAEETCSPLAESLLGQARSFKLNEEGIRQIEALLTELDHSPIESLLNEEEKAFLHHHIRTLLAERRKIWQAGILAKHPPVRILPHRVDDISNLSAFVLRHHDLCSKSIPLVDGYNAIKSSAEWATLDSQNFTKARNRFIELWELRAKDWKRVELVFDGQEERHWIEERGHLIVVYTDTRFESQRADRYIQSRMEELNSDNPGTKLFLITADRELKDSVSQWCNYYIEPRWALIPYLSIED
ncbi:MAG: NYN domain-containing protein [Deltaproteobacteria bacterium]|nr:NYN domain-containing protein [Deltaproteobacteria bacterium]